MSSSFTPQKHGLSSTGWGRFLIPVGGAIAFPQADTTWSGVVCLRKIASAVWGMTQHRDPGGYSFSSLPRATSLRLSSSIFSPIWTSSAGTQGKCLQMEFCVLPLSEGFWVSNCLSLTDRYPAAFYSHMLFEFFSQFWCCRLGTPVWGLYPTLLRGNAPATELSLQYFSYCPCDPSHPSHAFSAFSTIHAVM